MPGQQMMQPGAAGPQQNAMLSQAHIGYAQAPVNQQQVQFEDDSSVQ